MLKELLNASYFERLPSVSKYHINAGLAYPNLTTDALKCWSAELKSLSQARKVRRTNKLNPLNAISLGHEPILKIDSTSDIDLMISFFNSFDHYPPSSTDDVVPATKSSQAK